MSERYQTSKGPIYVTARGMGQYAVRFDGRHASLGFADGSVDGVRRSAEQDRAKAMDLLRRAERAEALAEALEQQQAEDDQLRAKRRAEMAAAAAERRANRPAWYRGSLLI
jgi:hypothetical protein